jgi:hypothetical protein
LLAALLAALLATLAGLLLLLAGLLLTATLLLLAGLRIVLLVLISHCDLSPEIVPNPLIQFPRHTFVPRRSKPGRNALGS